MTFRKLVLLGLCVASTLTGLASNAQTTTKQEPPLSFYKSEMVPEDSEKIPVSIDIAPEYFVWRESANGTSIHETGPRIQLGLLYRQPKDRGWLFGGMLRGYYGNVQYDGFNQVFTLGGLVLVPVTARTEYLGGLAEGQALYKSGLFADYTGSWMGAIGVDIWDRDLKGSGGYSELWTVAYVRGGYEVAPESDKGLVGDVGIKMPLYVANSANLSGVGNITVEPAQRPSGYFEAGYKFSRSLAVTGYFDSYWFGKSGVNSAGFFQPESTQYQFGLRVRWSFE